MDDKTEAANAANEARNNAKRALVLKAAEQKLKTGQRLVIARLLNECDVSPGIYYGDRGKELRAEVHRLREQYGQAEKTGQLESSQMRERDLKVDLQNRTEQLSKREHALATALKTIDILRGEDVYETLSAKEKELENIRNSSDAGLLMLCKKDLEKANQNIEMYQAQLREVRAANKKLWDESERIRTLLDDNEISY